MDTQNKDDAARHAYWADQVKAYGDFVEKLRNYPVEECGENLISLRRAVKDARLTVKFADGKIAGKHDRIFYLRESLVKNVIAAAREMNNSGWFIKIEDCYRTVGMQRNLALQDSVFHSILKRLIWENNDAVPSVEQMRERLEVFVATTPRLSAHMAGSAVDLTICHAGSLCDLERGSPYLNVSESTPFNSPFISEEALKNRNEINAIMEKYGFVPHPFKIWHFSQGDACAEYVLKSGKPARYGAVKFFLARGEAVSIENLDRHLYSEGKIREKLDSTLVKLKLK